MSQITELNSEILFLQAELEQARCDVKTLEIDNIQWHDEAVVKAKQIEKLKAELSLVNSQHLEREVGLMAELERARGFENYFADEHAKCMKERDQLKSEIVKMHADLDAEGQANLREHDRASQELAAAKGEIERLNHVVRQGTDVITSIPDLIKENSRLSLLAENYRTKLAEIAALTSENGCVEMAADMAQSVLNEDER